MEKMVRKLADFFGMWKNRIKEWIEIERKIYKDRKKFKLKCYKL